MAAPDSTYSCNDGDEGCRSKEAADEIVEGGPKPVCSLLATLGVGSLSPKSSQGNDGFGYRVGHALPRDTSFRRPANRSPAPQLAGANARRASFRWTYGIVRCDRASARNGALEQHLKLVDPGVNRSEVGGVNQVASARPVQCSP
jgi:hypothetical protein